FRFEPSQPARADPQIPIARERGAIALPKRGFLLGGLSNAGLAVRHDASAPKAGVRNPSPLPPFAVHAGTGRDHRNGPSGSWPRTRAFEPFACPDVMALYRNSGIIDC